jgi:RimJ/RimL family protein N-acetyltransferase
MQQAARLAAHVPTLETERLRLRAHRESDFDAIAAVWADSVVVRYTVGKPLSREEAWTKLVRNAGLWSVLGYGYWVLEEKATGDFVGELGFADFKRDIQPSIEGIPESGWILMPRFHGQGYATEAVRAALAWGDLRFGGRRTVCLIHEENTPSFRVAEKCGYREYQRTRYKEQALVMLER